jgi:transcriptional regulator with XRE-family HTH domain
MLTLVELMEAKRVDSYEKFARRAGMSSASVHKYGIGRNSDFPPVESIAGLATGLDVSPGLVVLAAAQGLGIDMDEVIEGSALGRALPPDVDQLPPYAQQVILDTARALVATMRGMTSLPAPEVDAEDDGPDLDEIARAARRRVDRARDTMPKTRQSRKS